MQPRSYQVQAEDSVFSYFAAKGGRYDGAGVPVPANPVIAMPTGTGKSHVIAGLAQRIMRMHVNTRIMMLTHVKELITQNAEKLLTLWPNAPLGIYSAQLRRKDTASPIIYGGVGSVANRVHAFGHRDILFIDECHLLSPDEDTQYQKIIRELRIVNPWLRVIGLSATPYRMGLGMVTDGGIFTDICCDQTTPEWFAWFIENKYMSPLIPQRTRTALDISNVSVSGGDFVKGALEAAVNVDAVTRAALAELCHYGVNRQSWLVFAAGIEHAEACAEILNEYGIAAAAVHSNLKPGQRDERILAHKAGRLRCIVGNNIFTTGYDFPPIDLIGMLRPTLSTALWVQMLGRGTRPYLGGLPNFLNIKYNCLVLDFAANRPRLGPIDAPTLPKPKSGFGGPAPVCICPHCDAYNHARARICIACGGDIEHTPELFKTADKLELMTPTVPIVEWVPVNYMLAAGHTSKRLDGPTSLRVTFVCGLSHFVHWVLLEHTGFAGKKARDWWRRFSGNEPPTSVNEALALFTTLPVPRRILVHINKDFPEVQDYEF